MRNIFNRFAAASIIARLRPALAVYGYQLALQASTTASGIALIYVLSKADYGMYALLVTITASATVLADLGLGPSVNRFVAQTEGPEQAGAILAAARQFQLLTIPAAALCVAALSWLSAANLALSAGWQVAIPAIALLSAVGQLQGSLAGAVLSGRGDYSAQPRVQALLALLRLALLTLVLVLPYAATAAAIALFVSILPYPLLRRRLSPLVVAPSGADGAAAVAERHAEIRRFLVPLIPNSFYFAFTGSIVTLIAGFFGSLATVADVAAVSRFTALFTILAAINVPLLLPRLSALLARAPERFVPTTLAVIGAGFSAAAVPVMLAILFPQPFLWVLGSGYEGLHRELALAMTSGAIPYAAGVVFTVLLAHGTTRGQALAVPLSIAAQIGTLLVIDRASATGPLLVGIAGSLVGLMLQLGLYGWFVLRGGAGRSA